MSNPVPIGGNFLLSIDKALVDEISTESGFKLYLAPEYNFETNVSVAGKVAVLPKNAKGDLKEGDEVVFSYHVVSNRSFPNTSELFVPISEGGKYIKIWMNGKGEKLRMMAHQGAISIFWTGTFFDKNGQFVQEKSFQGTEEQVERWAHTNFKFGDCENFTYKNLFTINEKDYWKCSYENIFAKKVGDEIVSIGDRVICEIMDVPVSEKELKKAGILIPASKVKLRYYDRGKVISGGESIGLSKGDIVSFDEKYCEKYSLWGKDYFIIKIRRVEGVWEN